MMVKTWMWMVVIMIGLAGCYQAESGETPYERRVAADVDIAMTGTAEAGERERLDKSARETQAVQGAEVVQMTIEAGRVTQAAAERQAGLDELEAEVRRVKVAEEIKGIEANGGVG
jgi:hypothetical protein